MLVNAENPLGFSLIGPRRQPSPLDPTQGGVV
jgi:hypothetical protein